MPVAEMTARIMTGSLLFKGLSEKDCRKLYDILRPVHKNYLRNDVVINEGDRVDDIGMVCSGYLIGVKIDQHGNQRMVQSRHQVQAVGLEAVTHPTMCSSMAILCCSDAEVIFFPYRKLLNSGLSHELQLTILMNMLDILSRTVHSQSNKLEIISQRSLRSRILTYLHSMMARHGSTTFHICMNREELASYLGVNRSALSHELSKMRTEGLVDYHKNRFTVLVAPEMPFILSCCSCPFAVKECGEN